MQAEPPAQPEWEKTLSEIVKEDIAESVIATGIDGKGINKFEVPQIGAITKI